MHYVFIVLFVLLSRAAWAQESAPLPDISVGGSASLSLFVNEPKNQDAAGFELFTGFQATDALKFEVGYADYALGHDDVSFSPWFVRTKTLIPVSPHASLYLGGGVGFDHILSPSLSAGINYQLSDHWYTDVGYQASFLVGPERQEHYVFNAGLVYRFGGSQPKAAVNVANVVAPVHYATEPTPSHAAATTHPVESENRDTECANWHQVEQDEYLIRIANEHHMSLEELLTLNPMFSYRNKDLIYPKEWLVLPNHCDKKSKNL